MQEDGFKKLFLVLVIISILLSVFNFGKILAAEPTFKLDDAKIEDKSSGVDASIEEFTYNKLITNTTFHKINDYVKYRLTIKNTSDTKYKLVLVDDNNSNENVTYEYSYNKDEELLPDSTVDVILTITYKEGIEQINQRTQNQEVKISFIIEDENGNIYEEEITINPKTGDNILIYAFLLVISFLALLAIVFIKKKSKLFVLLVLIIPMITYAVTPSLIIVLKNNTNLFDKVAVYKNINGVNEAVLVDYNTPYERPADPQIPGYDFDNWYVGSEVYNFDTLLTEDIELTAKFNIITYNITYDLDGGSVSGNPTTYNVETETFTLKNPTKEGYIFLGWSENDSNDLSTTITITKGSIGDKTFKANFEITQYTVSFDEQGGSSVNDITKNYNSEIGTLPTPKRTNYLFDGWYTNSTGGEKISSETKILGNVTYYAQWQKAKYLNDNVVFDGTNFINTDIYLFSDRNVDRDFEVSFEIDNYIWTSEMGTVMNAKDESTTPYSGIVVRQQKPSDYGWEVKTTIDESSYVSWYGYRLKKVIYQRINGIIYAYIKTNFNGDHYIQIDSTSLDRTFDVPVTFGSSIDGNGNPYRFFKGTISNMKVILYESNEGAIYFDANDGQGYMDIQRVNEKSSFSLSKNLYYRKDYIFTGWNTKKDGSGTKYQDEQSISNIVNNGENITLYAQWIEKEVAETNGIKYKTLQEAVNAVPTDNIETTIKLLMNTSENITVSQNQNIVFDFQTYTLSNDTSNPVLTNNGTIKIISGKINQNSAYAAINNNDSGILTISGGTILSNGGRAAVYNLGCGIVTISGDAKLRSNASGTANISGVTIDRGTVMNINNTGSITITGGTIVGTDGVGISNKGNLVLGVEDETIDNSQPLVMGKTYGIRNDSVFNFYDGIIKGVNDAINGTITAREQSTQIQSVSEIINGDTYTVNYLAVI